MHELKETLSHWESDGDREELQSRWTPGQLPHPGCEQSPPHSSSGEEAASGQEVKHVQAAYLPHTRTSVFANTRSRESKTTPRVGRDAGAGRARGGRHEHPHKAALGERHPVPVRWH